MVTETGVYIHYMQIMEVHNILFLCIIEAVMISASQPACTDSSQYSEETGTGSCSKDGQCEDQSGHGQREKRETKDAYEVQFEINLSKSVVMLLNREEIFQRLDEYLQQLTGEYVFNLTMFYKPDITMYSMVSFVLRPETLYIYGLLERIKYLVNLKTELPLFGLPVMMEMNTFMNKTIFWDGIKTIVRFELMVEYGWLEQKGILESNNVVAAFLQESFQISIRDIYDLTLIDSGKGRTAVLFSLPPVMTVDRQSLLEEVKSVVVSPCKDICIQSGNTDNTTECTSCKFVRLFETNVYPDHRSFQSFSGTWTGNEKKFAMAIIERKQCPDHQEMCTIGHGKHNCVGIGRCDKNFYRTLFGSIQVYGNIRVFDSSGKGVAIAAIEDSMSELHGLCRSALHAELFDHGRDKTGIGMRIEPSLGREKGIESLREMLETSDYIEVSGGLKVYKVENSFKTSYMDPYKPIPNYIENECFGCPNKQVWCILPNISLCLPKPACQEGQALFLKFANDTEIVRVSILMSSKTTSVNVTDDVKAAMKQQLAEQLNCSTELLTNVQIIQSEEGKFELGFYIVHDNNKELKELVIHLQLVTDRGNLYINLNETSLTAVPESLLYKQLISGYHKPKKDKIVASHLGDAITGGSLLAVLILVITFFIKAFRILNYKRVEQRAAVREPFKDAEKTPARRRQQFQNFLSRK